MRAAEIRQRPSRLPEDSFSAIFLEAENYPGGPSKAILGAYDKTDGRWKVEKPGLQQVALKAPTYDGNDAEIDSGPKGVGKGGVGIGKTAEREEFRLVIDVRDAE